MLNLLAAIIEERVKTNGIDWFQERFQQGSLEIPEWSMESVTVGGVTLTERYPGVSIFFEGEERYFDSSSQVFKLFEINLVSVA